MGDNRRTPHNLATGYASSTTWARQLHSTNTHHRFGKALDTGPGATGSLSTVNLRDNNTVKKKAAAIRVGRSSLHRAPQGAGGGAPGVGGEWPSHHRADHDLRKCPCNPNSGLFLGERGQQSSPCFFELFDQRGMGRDGNSQGALGCSSIRIHGGSSEICGPPA